MNRRKFLAVAGTLGAGLIGSRGAWARRPLAAPVPSASRGADVVRLGVIGTGSRGTGLLRSLATVGGLRAVACCDVLPFRLEQGLARAGEGCRAYSDYRALLDDRNVDAVVIATPLHLHHRMAVDALDAGKHVYCEKTMTYGIDEALDLVSRARARPAQVFQVGFQYRYHPLYLHVAELVREGELGRVTHVAMQWNRNGDWRRPVPDPKLERQINWRMYREYSGGLLAELGAHQLDFVSWVFDARPSHVVGAGGIDYWRDGRETFDNVHAVWTFPDGMKASFTSLTANAHGGYSIELRGSRGTIELGVDSARWFVEELNAKELGLVDGVSGATITKSSDGIAVELPTRKGWNGTHYALQGFREAITRGTAPSSDVVRGARSTIATRLAIDATRSGEPRSWRAEWDAPLGS
jgi:predicted dehydrogenase